MKKLLIAICLSLLFPISAFALSTYLPYQGGTGTNCIPTQGQVLLGTSGGVYNCVATSSLGITSGSSINTNPFSATYFIATSTIATSSFPVASSTTICLGGSCLSAWPTSATWGAITGTLSSQTDLWNYLQTLLSTTTAASTYYPLTNPSNYISLGSLSGGTGISYNNSTGVITNNAPDQTVVLTNGTGISTSGTYPNFTITNTSPDQTVALTGASGITTSGTYPNFTISGTALLSTTSAASTYVPYTGATGLVNLGSQSLTTSGTVSATNTLATNATTTNQVYTGITSSFLATDPNGKVIATTSPISSITITSPTSTITVGGTGSAPTVDIALGHANTWSAAQSLPASGLLIKGSSTGYNTFAMANTTATAYTTTIPANTGTVAELNIVGQTFTQNQQITNAVTTNPTLVVKQVAAQTADNYQQQDSSGNVLRKDDINGTGYFGGTGSTIIQDGLIVNQMQGTTSAETFNAKGSSDTNLIYTDTNNDRVGIGTSTPTTKLSVVGTITSTALAVNAAQTVVNCSTSGTATFSEPEQGITYKQVIVYQAACLGTAAYTFHTAFTNTPDSIGANAATVTAISTTAMTVTGATTSGFLQAYGY